MQIVMAIALLVGSVGIGITMPRDSVAFQIQVSRDQFSEQINVFSSVTNFVISIEVPGPLAPGLYMNPPLGDIEFLIEGTLDPTTPARTANPAFTSFAVADLPLLRGQEFYDLGNALSFEISSGANLNDGLQVSELVGEGLVFEFDGRELGTGRYHPPLFELFSDGTGRLRNSNNTGGINPATGVEVNAMIGDEYVTELGFEPTTLTIAVSEPSMGMLPAIGTALLCAALRRTRACFFSCESRSNAGFVAREKRS
jgi:hypothetical protein